MKTAMKWGIVVAVAAFFLAAGLTKAADPGAFALAILRYRIVGEDLAWVGALWLPWMEMLGALALFSKRMRPGAIGLLVLLLLLFEVALASAAWRGLNIECGCLGGVDSSSVQFALIRNLVLLGALAVLPRLERPPA